MKKIIELNIRHPKLVLVFITAFTFFSLAGFRNLYFDGSTEALMPKKEPTYLIGERAKKKYGDSKTFLIASIQLKNKDKHLLSYDVFNHLLPLVKDLEEFKEFNYAQEEKRMSTLLNLAAVSIKENTSIQEKTSENITEEIQKNQPDESVPSFEDELDREIFGEDRKSNSEPSSEENPVNEISDFEKEMEQEIYSDENPVSEDSDSSNHDELKIPAANEDSLKRPVKKPVSENSPDYWDLSRSVEEDYYVKSSRERHQFDYSQYKPVSIKSLKNELDEAGTRQLEYILFHKKIHIKNPAAPLDQDTFSEILEFWETLYLYKDKEIIKTLINPITGEDIIGTKDELKPVDLIETDEMGNYLIPQKEEGWQNYRSRLFANKAFEYGLYSKNESGEIQSMALNVILRPQKDHTKIFNYFFDTINQYNAGDISIIQAGVPVIKKYVQDYMKSDLQTFLPIVIFIVIFTFYLNFRLIRGVILPSVSVLLGMIWTLGILGHFQIPITMVVNILPPLLIAVGSSYSIHIFNQYLHDQELIHSEGKKAGLVISMSYISLTVILAALTTFAGFMTLSTNQVTSLRHFGVFAALGTVLSTSIAVTMIPAALMMMKLLPQKNKDDEKREHQNHLVKSIIHFFSHLTLNHPRIVVIVSALFIAFFTIGIFRLHVETAPMFYFEKDSYVYQSDLTISQNFRGAIALNLIIDSGKKGGAKDPEFLKFIERLRTFITSEEGKDKYHQLHTLAFGDIIKRMHKAMNEDKDEFYRIPDNPVDIEDYIQLYSGEDRDSDGRMDAFEQFVDREYREVNVVVRTGTWKGKLFRTSMNKKGQERIRRYMESDPYGKNLKWRMTGETINFAVLSELIVRGQFFSIFLTIIIVAVIVFLLFQSFRASLLSVIPISTSIVLVYGFMGFLDIPLDIPKSLLAAIAIGIGVDDTIHMLKTLRYELARGYTMREAIANAHNEAGMAIVYTSLALIFGFSVLMLSEFEPVFYLGWLIASTMVVTTVSALVLLPSVICTFKVDLNKKYTKGIFKWIHLNHFFEIDESKDAVVTKKSESRK